ncbi:MAG: hypothetical protein CVU90_08050 [Firmicutes bacterium HGW-Firmicutes-15]|nr:MAG: hypothetical protein CVU90_08050 [Firmicutes bacterium HGW-Firmicutes-15]
MKDENMTKDELLDELAKLRQENIELKLAQKDQSRIYLDPECSSTNRWFSSGRAEAFVSNRPEQEPAVNHPVKYLFSDLVDIAFLQQLMNSFYEATGISNAVIDVDNNILSKTGWQDICTQFHRVCAQTECRCKQSDSYIAAHLHDGSYVGYTCLNGLIDYSIPIIVEGQHLATIFLGQLLHAPPDENFFRSQAQEYGFDEVKYIEALRRVPIIPENHIEFIMIFHSQLGQFLATMGLERKRQLEATDQTLRERDERLRLVWEVSNDYFWDWNIETGDAYFSPRWVEMLEYSLEELEQHYRTWEKHLHTDDTIAIMKVLDEHLEGRTAQYEDEYRMLTKSGGWKWVMVRGQVVARNEAGQPLRMTGTTLDITARKQAEFALLQSEEKFFKAFHGNPDIMSISTLKEGRFTEVNSAFEEMSGYKRDEIIGHTSQELLIWFVPEQRDIVIKHIQEHGSIRGYEIDHRLKSGEIRTFNMSVEIIDIDGEPHLLISNRDITQSKQMEEALRLSEECLSKAFNASPIIMSITTLEDGRFIKINNGFCRITGYSQTDAMDRTALELGFWADIEERCLVKQKILAKQSVRDMEIHFRKNTGEQRLGLLAAEGIHIDGERCLLSVLTDITERKQMETEMTRLDRLNLVGEMAASIGHEIRNPMTTVRGYLQILRENKDYSQELEYFDLMIEELDRANSIITEFLSLAKNKIVDMHPRDLNAIIRKSLPLILAKAMSKDQYIKLELHDLPDLLLDKKEIRQLILNLVNNGLESMASTGDVIIRTFMENENAILAIQDQGHGIDHELLDKLGTPFFTTKEHGTGLGLAVCYRIVARHNAKIDIATSSTGTTFYVRFPIYTVAAKVS